jgi:hypothetical protein
MISMKRLGLKLFSLCVLALGLVAFSATAAQGAVWMVNGANLSANKEVAGKLDENHGILLVTLGLNKVEFLCTAGELLNTKLELAGAVSEASKNARADFSGCITRINGITVKACEPKAIGKAAGTIVTEELYALLQLHPATGEGVIVITPKVGNVFADIHMGEACPIGELVSVFGALALHDVGVELNKDELETERPNHLVAEFKPLTALKVANAKSESVATLDGMADIVLASGEKWSGLKQ